MEIDKRSTLGGNFFFFFKKGCIEINGALISWNKCCIEYVASYPLVSIETRENKSIIKLAWLCLVLLKIIEVINLGHALTFYVIKMFGLSKLFKL